MSTSRNTSETLPDEILEMLSKAVNRDSPDQLAGWRLLDLAAWRGSI